MIMCCIIKKAYDYLKENKYFLFIFYLIYNDKKFNVRKTPIIKASTFLF